MHARFGAGPLLLIAVGLLPSCGKIVNPWGGPTTARRAETSSIVGQPAPDIDGADVDGNRLRLSDYRGQIVVLHFWGHW